MREYDAFRQERSSQPIAAIDTISLRDDIISVVRRQKDGNPGQVLRFSHPAVGDRVAHHAFGFTDRSPLVTGEFFIYEFPKWGVYNARSNCVHIDSVFDQGQPRRLSYADDDRFRAEIDRNERFTAPAGLTG